jgi:hypothetical protein
MQQVEVVISPLTSNIPPPLPITGDPFSIFFIFPFTFIFCSSFFIYCSLFLILDNNLILNSILAEKEEGDESMFENDLWSGWLDGVLSNVSVHINGFRVKFLFPRNIVACLDCENVVICSSSGPPNWITPMFVVSLIHGFELLVI